MADSVQTFVESNTVSTTAKDTTTTVISSLRRRGNLWSFGDHDPWAEHTS